MKKKKIINMITVFILTFMLDENNNYYATGATDKWSNFFAIRILIMWRKNRVSRTISRSRISNTTLYNITLQNYERVCVGTHLQVDPLWIKRCASLARRDDDDVDVHLVGIAVILSFGGDGLIASRCVNS